MPGSVPQHIWTVMHHSSSRVSLMYEDIIDHYYLCHLMMADDIWDTLCRYTRVTNCLATVPKRSTEKHPSNLMALRLRDTTSTVEPKHWKGSLLVQRVNKQVHFQVVSKHFFFTKKPILGAGRSVLRVQGVSEKLLKTPAVPADSAVTQRADDVTSLFGICVCLSFSTHSTPPCCGVSQVAGRSGSSPDQKCQGAFPSSCAFLENERRDDE